MIEKLLLKLTYDRPLRIISDGGQPYLERHYIGQLFGYVFYIHRFVGSDPDRGLHDHPWKKAYSIVLSGYYFEENRMGGKRVRWFNSLTGDTFHRVVLEKVYVGFDPDYSDYVLYEKPCWTLFFHTKDNVKRWGFLRHIHTVKGLLYKINQQVDLDTMIFEPYEYTREGSQVEWWDKPDVLTRRKLEAGHG